MRRPWAAIFLTILLFARAIAAQSPALNEPRSPGRVEGLRGDPAPPLPPEVIARDDDGHATVRAIPLTSPLRVDGKLDEEVYQRELPFGGFIQVAPRYGAAQTERSDVWVMFDGEYIYVSCRCWDSAPADKWIANELRRDTTQLRQNDQFGVSFDTFYDRRNGFAFYTNPLGARADYSIVDEGAPNSDWNPVWDSEDRPVRGRLDGGDGDPVQVAALSLGPDEMWGFQMRRAVRRKNEWGYLTRIPQNLAGPQGMNRISSGGTLVGLDLPPAGKNLELKPYAISRLTTDRIQTPALRNDLDRRSRRRREVRRHRQPHRRLHLQHRLRAGRDRRAAGEPDALQPVLPGEARVLPRRARHLRLRPRRQRRRRVQPAAVGNRQPAVSVLQPAHRPESRPRHPDRRRRTPHRQGRQVRRRHHEHPDRRRSGVADRADQLLGGAREARHPAAQQHRRDGDQPLAVGRGRPGRTRATASTRRCRSSRTSRSAATTRAPTRRASTATTTATRGSSTTAATATARTPST